MLWSCTFGQSHPKFFIFYVKSKPWANINLDTNSYKQNHVALKVIKEKIWADPCKVLSRDFRTFFLPHEVKLSFSQYFKDKNGCCVHQFVYFGWHFLPSMCLTFWPNSIHRINLIGFPSAAQPTNINTCMPVRTSRKPERIPLGGQRVGLVFILPALCPFHNSHSVCSTFPKEFSM